MNEKERSNLLEKLNSKQRKFLEDNIKQLKCNLWVEKLAKLKGIEFTSDVDEEILAKKIDDWVLVDVLDGGYMNRPYRCMCGKSLRRQYILKNKSRDITLKLGQECLKKYTKLDEMLIRDILNGFHKVNSELDDILNRYSQGLTVNHIKYLKEGVLPAKYREQIEIGLPLSERQESKAQKLIKEYNDTIEEQNLLNELIEIEEGLSVSQRKFINTSISKEDKHQLIIRLKNGDYIHKIEDLEGINVSDIIDQKIKIKLPLTHEEEKKIEVRKILNSSKRRRDRFSDTVSVSRKINQGTEEKTIDHGTISCNHGDLLKDISEKEHIIPGSLQKDWDMIKSMIKDSEEGKDIPRRKFLLMLSNIATSIGIYADIYDYYR